MQIKTLLQKKGIRIFIKYFLGPILFIWLSYSIYTQIKSQPGLERSWQHIKERASGSILWNLLAVLVLMIVNWSLETAKWKLCVSRIQRIGFLTAFKAVLSGVSFSVSTPNRIGEYLGRVLYMNEGNRLKAISLTITGSMSQLIVTLVMGLAGFVLLRPEIEASGMLSGAWIDVLFYGILVVTCILTLFYFRIAWFIRWLDRWPRIRRHAWLFRELGDFNATLLLQLLSLSATRFFVFIVQYYLLFRLFDVDISWWDTWWTTSVSFLVMAVIPTIALFTDLGLRGKINLQLLGVFSQNDLGIGLVSVSIWFINLVIPALTGSLLILSIKKVFKNKNEANH